MDIKIKTALISVSDKSGLEKVVQSLKEHNIKIVSTGGTAKSIAAMGVDVTDVSSLTNFPEMMDGRVKTLHPNVHGGLLSKRDDKNHVQSQEEYDQHGNTMPCDYGGFNSLCEALKPTSIKQLHDDHNRHRPNR